MVTSQEYKDEYNNHLVFLLGPCLLSLPVETSKVIENVPDEFGIEVTPKKYKAPPDKEVAQGAVMDEAILDT